MLLRFSILLLSSPCDSKQNAYMNLVTSLLFGVVPSFYVSPKEANARSPYSWGNYTYESFVLEAHPSRDKYEMVLEMWLVRFQLIFVNFTLLYTLLDRYDKTCIAISVPQNVTFFASRCRSTE